MFENSKILEARFTNNERSDVMVIYKTEQDGTLEAVISIDSNEYKMLNQMGWDEEKIIDCTAEYKRQSINTMNAIVKAQAADVYKDELARLQLHVMKNKSLVLKNKALLEKQKADILMSHAAIKSIEEKIPEKIESTNSFVNSSIDENKLSESFDKIIMFLKTVNENKEAIEILKQKSKSKNIKPKTVTEVLFKHIVK